MGRTIRNRKLNKKHKNKPKSVKRGKKKTNYRRKKHHGGQPVTQKQKLKKPKKLVILDDDEIDLKKPDDEVIMETKMETQEPQTEIVTAVGSNKKRWNETLVDLMGQLEGIVKRNGEPFFKQRAYKKAQETIMQVKEDITSADQLKGKPNIGSTIYEKIVKYMNEGTLPMIERDKNNPINIFSDIYGVGPAKAKELVAAGVTSLDQLRERQDELLNAKQKIGLKYYEDIQKRIPRKEIDEYNYVFDEIFQNLLQKQGNVDAKYEIVGSYRRGAETSGDIDVIITAPNNDIYKLFIDELKSRGIITEILSQGPIKCLVIAKLPNKDEYRRVDFMYSTPEQYPFSILYFTGSKYFNTSMRARALELGLSLNEHDFTIVDKKKKGAKPVPFNRLFKDEKDIFDFLGMEYKKPEDRIDGQSVVIVNDGSQVKIAIDEQLNQGAIKEQVIEKDVIQEPVPVKQVDNVVMSNALENKMEDMISVAQANPPEKKKVVRKKKEKKDKEETVAEVVGEAEKSAESIMDLLPNIPIIPGENALLKAMTDDGEKKSPKKKSASSKKTKSPKEKKPRKPRSLKKKLVTVEEKAEESLEKQLQVADVPPVVEEEVQETVIPETVVVEEVKVKPVEEETLKIKPKTEKKPRKKVSKSKDISEKQYTNELKKPVTDEEVLEYITAFKKMGIQVLDKLSEDQLAAIVINCDKAFHYNKEPLMSDNEYDIVKDYMEKKYPLNPIFTMVGTPIEKNKVDLPYEMASMDKIKPDTGALDSWKQKYKGPYVLSCKLDGVSGMYSTEGEKPKLYTRGNGHIGQDVSHLIPFLNLPKHKNIVVRGEFIIPKSVFKNKYAANFANIRNLVAGIVNRQTIDEKAADLHFVSYEVIKPVMIPSKQMSQMIDYGFETVQHKVVDNVTNDMLSDLLVDWRTNYIYEIDGIICSDDQVYSRKSGNPDHAFAFKMVLSDQKAEAKVVDVIWTPSKDGYLKPRVRIEPVQLGGVTIEYATGFNGAFIEQNKIGVGAMIEIIRSGDVIPYIKSVTTPAANAKMPSVPFKWNDTHIDVMLENIDSDSTVREKNITGFFRGIGVEGLSSGNIARIIDAGFDSIPKIIQMTESDFLKVDGFKQKLATKIYNGIQEGLQKADLLTLMSASNVLGRGLSAKKMEPILEEYPDILVSSDSKEEKIKKVMSVKGMAKKTAELFVENIPVFIQFMKDAGLEEKLQVDMTAPKEVIQVDETGPLFKKSIVMTGVRDDDVKENAKKYGYKLSSGVSKNTFVVIAKSKDEKTGKAEEARKAGIPIMTVDEFKTTYFA